MVTAQLLGPLDGVVGNVFGIAEASLPDIDPCAISGNGHYVAFGAAFDAALPDGVHVGAGFLEATRAGKYHGIDGAGAERNWHVDVRVFQFERAPQTGFVEPLPVREARSRPHRERLTGQRR